MVSSNNQVKNDIFDSDLFDRKIFIEGKIHPLCEFLIKEGGAICIHAPFGKGKTIFCDYYKKYLNGIEPEAIENQKQLKVYQAMIVDAFLHDYVDEPFVPIHQAIDKLIRDNKPQTELLNKFKEHGIKLLKRLAKSSIRRVPMIGETLEQVFDSTLESILTQPIENEIEEYKTVLRSLTQDQPVIIFIDELDRCRPNYALLFLERLKHYFYDIKNLLFVLTINKEQLFTSITHEYGIRNASDYVEKFLRHSIIDLPLISKHQEEFGLQVGKDYSFDYIHLEHTLKTIRDDIPQEYITTAAAFLHAMGLNLRQHAKLGLSIQTIRFEGDVYSLAFITVLNIKDSVLRYRIQKLDEDVYKEILKLLNDIKPKFLQYGNDNFFASLLEILQLAIDNEDIPDYLLNNFSLKPFQLKARVFLRNLSNKF